MLNFKCGPNHTERLKGNYLQQDMLSCRSPLAIVLAHQRKHLLCHGSMTMPDSQLMEYPCPIVRAADRVKCKAPAHVGGSR